MAHLLAFSLCIVSVFLSGAEKVAALQKCAIVGQSVVSTFNGSHFEIEDPTHLCRILVSGECKEESTEMIINIGGLQSLGLEVLLAGTRITAQRKPRPLIDIDISFFADPPKREVEVFVNGTEVKIPHTVNSNGQTAELTAVSVEELTITNALYTVIFHPSINSIIVERHQPPNSQLCGLCSAVEWKGCEPPFFELSFSGSD